ncbi:MAG: hypothetical protein IPP29_03325 [Bacteroidetes bacterium]|nr:hypothetical protein [Bacteroidota bacterium]
MKTIIKMVPIMIVFSWIHLSAQIVNNPDVIICPSCFVDCDNIFNQTEDAVYINPIDNQIAIVANNSVLKPNPYTTGVFITTDGGQTWDENYNVPQSSYDPTVAIDNAGHYYLGRINSGEIFVSKFDDLFNQGLWENFVVDNINSPDKPHIWINNNTIYCVWTRTKDSQTDPKLHVYISKADINSFTTSWQMPVKVNSNVAGTFPIVENVKTGPLGQVYVVWSIYDIP